MDKKTNRYVKAVEADGIKYGITKLDILEVYITAAVTERYIEKLEVSTVEDISSCLGWTAAKTYKALADLNKYRGGIKALVLSERFGRSPRYWKPSTAYLAGMIKSYRERLREV